MAHRGTPGEMRRERASHFQKVENMRQHRQKMYDMLVQKLTSKYGRRHHRIGDEVHAFLARTEVVTEASLRELEKLVASKASCHDKRAAAPPSQSNAHSERADRPQTKHGTWMDGLSEWKVIDAYHAIENEANAKRAFAEAKHKQCTYRSMLDDQVRQSKSTSQLGTAVADDKVFAETQAKLLEEWRQEMQRQRDLQLRKQLEEKKVRDLQVKWRKEQVESEQRARREREERELDECRVTLERERRQVMDKRLEAREQLRAIQMETAKERALQARRKHDESQEDKLLMDAFKAKLDREEEARQSAFTARMKRLEHFTMTSRTSTKGAGYQEQQMLKKREQRILADAKRKEEADIERERRDMQTLREKQRQITLENSRILQEKRENERKQLEEDQKFASCYVRDSQAYLRSEADRMLATRAAMYNHRKALEDQIQEAKAAKVTTDMDTRERLINKSLLEKISNDKEILSKLQERFTPVRQAPTRNRAARS